MVFFSTFELCICIFLFINGLEGIINNLFLLQLVKTKLAF